jgi:hypothetical protein
MATSTPPFVRWTLARRCELREETDPRDPEATERQLRPLRTYVEAVFEERIFADVCFATREVWSKVDVDPGEVRGFRASEVLQAYGGEDFIRGQCDGCPANIFRERTGANYPVANYAGCYGLLACDDVLGAQWEACIAKLDLAAAIDTNFLPTTPRWYGLFAAAPLNALQLDILFALLTALSEMAGQATDEFRRAVQLAQAKHAELHVALYPAGEYDRDAWRTSSHCRRCVATMLPREHRCSVCGLIAKPRPERLRKPRGQRPYVPLTRFLGAEGAAELLKQVREVLS